MGYSIADVHNIKHIGGMADAVDAFVSAHDWDSFRASEVRFVRALVSGRISVCDIEVCLPYVFRHGRKGLAMAMTHDEWVNLAAQLDPERQAYLLALRLAAAAPKYLPGGEYSRARPRKGKWVAR